MYLEGNVIRILDAFEHEPLPNLEYVTVLKL